MNVRLFDTAMGSPSGIGLITSNLKHSQEELLRVASLLYYLEENGISVSRANMSTRPEAFWAEEDLLDHMMSDGDDILPAWYDGEKLLWSGAYPSNAEVAKYYGIEDLQKPKALPKEAFAKLWEEAEAWGMCNTSDCSTCSGCA